MKIDTFNNGGHVCQAILAYKSERKIAKKKQDNGTRNSPLWRPKKSRSPETKKSPEREIKILPNSAKILNEAWESEIEAALIEKKNDDQKLNYEEFQMFLKDLSIPDEIYQKEKDLKLKPALEFWQILDGEKRSGVTKQAVKTVFKAIFTAVKGSIEDSISDKKEIGKYEENGNYTLNQQEANLLRKKYQMLFLDHIRAKKKPLKNEHSNSQNCSKPSINKNANELASQARNKVISNALVITKKKNAQEPKEAIALNSANVPVFNILQIHNIIYNE